MIKDKLDRKFEYLRISVTDKCNYRCIYCMPKEVFGSKHKFLRKNELLTYEEIIEVAKTLKPFGLKKIRLTGGEPLLRKNIEYLVEGLKKEALIGEYMITTNGSLLTKEKLVSLKKGGLDSVTISSDAASQKIGNIIKGKVSTSVALAKALFKTVPCIASNKVITLETIIILICIEFIMYCKLFFLKIRTAFFSLYTWILSFNCLLRFFCCSKATL